MLNNVKDPPFLAKGDGTTDDRAAIQAAIDDAAANHKGGILIPPGEYRLSYPNGARGSLVLNGVQDFMVLGEGPKSVVKLADTPPPPPPEPGDWHVFLLRNDCRRVVFKDLVIDGNRTGLTHPDEQSHGVEVESGTEDLVIDRCIVRECFGDGVRLAGTDQVGKTVRRVRIQNCLFQTNNRSGLSIQRAVEQIIVAHCHFDANVSDQSIDFEPTGSGGPTNLVVQGCIINHTNPTKAVTLSGLKGPDPLFNCKFIDNIVLGGPISCSDVNQLTIQNNTVLVTHLGTTVERIPVQVQRGGDAVIISGNLLVNDDTATEAVISLSEANQRQVTRAGHGQPVLRPFRQRDPVPFQRRHRHPRQHDRRHRRLQAGRVHPLGVFRHGPHLGAGQRRDRERERSMGCGHLDRLERAKSNSPRLGDGKFRPRRRRGHSL